MSKRSRVLICVAALLLLAAPVMAQNQWRIEFFGAGTVPVDKKYEVSAPQSTSPLYGKQDYGTGVGGGVRLGVDGRGHWGQDIAYSFSSNSCRIVNDTTGVAFPFHTGIHQVHINALWYPTGLSGEDQTVFPYLTAGVGASFHTLSQGAVNEASDPGRAGIGELQNDYIFAFNAGGGVRFRINKVYGFRIDFKDYMSKPVRYGLPKESSNPAATVFPVRGTFHILEVSFAFVYYF
jgi:hypothetical protein